MSQGCNRRRSQSLSVLAILIVLLIAAPQALAKDQLQRQGDNPAGDAYSNPALRPEILPSSQAELPKYPADLEKNNQTLSGGASLTAALTFSAEIMDHNPLSRYRGDKLVFMRVHVQNNGAKPVLVLGRDAKVAASDDRESRTVSATTLEGHDNTLLTPREKALVGAVGVGSAGLASSLFYEIMTPSEHRKRDLGIALGRDRGRHEVEAENLGTRLIMPGDETVGWVAFEEREVLPSSNSLKLPIMFAPYDAVSATVLVPVKGSLAAPMSK